MKNVVNRALAAKKTKLFTLLFAVLASVSVNGILGAIVIRVDGICYELDPYGSLTVNVVKDDKQPYGYRGDITIPASITYKRKIYKVIGTSTYDASNGHYRVIKAFEDCPYLTSLTLPGTITNASVSNCASLKSLTIPYGIKSIMVTDCIGLTVLTLPNTITDIFISSCPNLKSLNIPDAVTGLYLNECSGLTSIILPIGIKTIRDWAFRNCSSLQSIIIPDGVTKIDREAFVGCKNLRSVVLPNSVDTIKRSAFSGCTNLTEINLPNSIASIEQNAFNGCQSLTSITLPESISTIENYTFSGCSGLTNVTIPNGVTCISQGAFSNCKSLTSVEFPNSVTCMGEYAFSFCDGLTSVTLSKNMTSIAQYAFIGCQSLTSITIPDKINNIGERAFCNCVNLTSLNIPDNVKNIGKESFMGCRNLISISIGKNVTTIDEKAFYNCDHLLSATIPSNVTKIGNQAFYTINKSAKIFTSSSANMSNIGIPTERIIKVPEEQLLYYVPYSVFAKNYVEENVNKWQQRDEFERMAEWKQRVNEENRMKKIKSLLAESSDKFIAFHTGKINLNLQLGKYDADNEVFSVSDAKYGTAYIAVPYNEAKDFKTNWDKKKVNYHMQVVNEEITLTSFSVKMPNGKQYSYRNTDAINYNLAEADFQFAPIELGDLTAHAPQQNQNKSAQQNVTTTKVTIGNKSKIDTDIPVSGVSNPNTFVIIFANEDYKNVASVPFARNDGSVFQKYCQRTLGIPVSNIHYVENATFNDMRIQLAWLNDVCKAYKGSASLIIYYAGHGIPDESDKSAYLLPVDGDGRYVQSAYKLDEMYQKLGAMNAKAITVFIDACFSGSKREDGMLASARGIALKSNPGQPQGNMVVFSAAQGDETAYPIKDEQHGMFTYYLLKKLQETKGDVTLSVLGDYITTNVSQQSIVKNGKPQTPSVNAASAISNEWRNWKLR